MAANFLPQIPVAANERLATAGGVAGCERPEIGASGWAEPESRVDAGRNCSSLPKADKRLPTIVAAAEAHERAGLAAVTGEHYEGGHWLGSFAVYLVTGRGIGGKGILAGSSKP